MAENDVAAPVSGEAKKKRGGIGAVLDRKDDEIARLKAELEAERAAKAATAQPTTTGDPSPILKVEAAAPAAPPSPVPQGYDIQKDPLGWIVANRVDRVCLVSTDSHLNLSPTRRMNGVPRQEYPPNLKATRVGEWSLCPFEFRGRNEQETKELRLQNAQHHFFYIDDYIAADVWGRPRTKGVPAEAIVDPANFKGLHPTGRWPMGTKTPSSGHGLTEAVRALLQNYDGRLWIEYGTHEEACCKWIHWKRPNPYSSSYALTGASSIRVDENVSHGHAGREVFGGS